jgi:hypothetical protein
VDCLDEMTRKISHLRKVAGRLAEKNVPLFLPSTRPYDAYWQVFQPVGHSWLSQETLRAQNAQGDLMELAETPHASFVAQYLGLGGSRELWREYQRNQHGYTSEQLEIAEKRFENLISKGLKEPSEFLILVKVIGCYAVIFDGFHRASILVTAFPNKKIHCAIL